MYPTAPPAGTTVRLNENPCAIGIAPQGAGGVLVVASVESITGIVIVPPAGIDGPEKGLMPLNPAARPRVSTSRQGVTATKVSGPASAVVGATWRSGMFFLSAWLGCQNRGVDQFFSGTAFSCILCPFTIKGK